jgi:hypothetical protein|tara:strand:+ start:847 stop:1065 length:219 start_codon:yes stop_codon:yes gene_type:complete
VGVLLAILRAIPALRGLADTIEKVFRRAEAQKRREDKLDHIDSAIADAVAHPSERVRDEEAELLEGSDRDPS